MKVNHTWLQQWLTVSDDVETVAGQLTMAGLEVDTVEPAAGDFHGVVVAYIAEAKPHPDADRLRVCQLDTGSGSLTQVVCGGKNAREGIKVAFAQVGAVLPGDFKLKKAKLRGVESFGMICSESELGLGEGEDHCIMELPMDAPLGADLREFFDLDDHVYDIELTPNRGDCTSIRGIARDLAVVTQQTLLEPEVQMQSETVNDRLSVNIESPSRCSHYVGRVIKGVNLNVPTPIWMQERLRRLGLRSINYIVDVTNYVMMELGQPMHAFDLAKLTGDIHVRLANQDESLLLLDEQEIVLAADDLVIADDSGALALAGVMGGQSTCVDKATQDIFLESAYFAPAPIMLSARRHKLATDSSYRFERGVDFALQRRALERASELIVAHAGGQLGPVVDVANDQYHPKITCISLTYDAIEQLLGVELGRDFVIDALQRLGMQLSDTDYGWDVRVPSYRSDIQLQADLIEELARVYGYNNIPMRRGRMDVVIPESQEMRRNERQLAAVIRQRGFHEAMTYSFIAAKDQQNFYPEVDSVVLANPMAEDMAVMRAGLLPGLVNAVSYNVKRQQERVCLFEVGRVFARDQQANVEHNVLAMAMLGLDADFFSFKGELEHILDFLGVNVTWLTQAAPGFHPGRCAELFVSGASVGVCGQLHPDLAKKMHIKNELYLCELNLDALAVADLTEFKPLSKFPSVRRDIAIVVSDTINYSNIHELIAKSAIELLQSIQLFDIYQGEGVEPGSKSLALGLTFQAQDRTLVDEEIQTTMQEIISALETHFNAQLRA